MSTLDDILAAASVSRAWLAMVDRPPMTRREVASRLAALTEGRWALLVIEAALDADRATDVPARVTPGGVAAAREVTR